MASVENDAIFEFLHMEIVSQVLRHEKETKIKQCQVTTKLKLHRKSKFNLKPVGAEIA